MKINNQKQDLHEYIKQLEKDTKPILTFADIDEKMKSGVFRRTFLEPLPKWLKIMIAVVVTGLILYGLFENIMVSLWQ